MWARGTQDDNESPEAWWEFTSYVEGFEPVTDAGRTADMLDTVADLWRAAR